MEDNNRINRRSRPRPYDLRRKVLLKNFLREQMTHIAETRIDTTSQSSADFAEATDSVQLDVPVLNEDLSSTVAENVQSSSSVADNNNNNSDSTPVDDIMDVNNSTVDAIASDDNRSEYSSMFKFTNFVKLKKESKRPKIVFKAKELRKQVKSPMKTRSFRSGIERVFYGRKKSTESSTSNQTPRSSPRSLFSLFKHRREQRHAKEVDRTKNSPGNTPVGVPTKYSTINQAVQTDDSWVREEMIKVKQSNRRLKEENRLLSESLSYFMSGASMDPHVRQSSTASQQKHTNNTIFPDYYFPPPNLHSDNWSSKSRVSRSKSVHEQSERKTLLRSHYPTRSMSFHHRRDIPSPNIRQSGSVYVPQNDTNRSRARKRNMFTNPPSNSSRGIQRRSSMPERILSENDRSVPCRRSDSMRDSRRRPFYMLSSEAFY